mmetsp:Transcript_4552/g.7891  ORF Transcript_4552/g.7891 Transcript_4552/m.7891 type:complete len:1010 (-) Transcript_4552:2887-5916(-)
MSWSGGAGWGGFGDVLAKVTDLKDNLEKQMDEAMGVEEGEDDKDVLLSGTEELTTQIMDRSGGGNVAENNAESVMSATVPSPSELLASGSDFFGSFGVSTNDLPDLAKQLPFQTSSDPPVAVEEGEEESQPPTVESAPVDMTREDPRPAVERSNSDGWDVDNEDDSLDISFDDDTPSGEPTENTGPGEGSLDVMTKSTEMQIPTPDEVMIVEDKDQEPTPDGGMHNAKERPDEDETVVVEEVHNMNEEEHEGNSGWGSGDDGLDDIDVPQASVDPVEKSETIGVPVIENLTDVNQQPVLREEAEPQDKSVGTKEVLSNRVDENVHEQLVVGTSPTEVIDQGHVTKVPSRPEEDSSLEQNGTTSTSELDYLRGALLERERQLESSIQRSTELFQESDTLREAVEKLTNELKHLKEAESRREVQENSRKQDVKVLQDTLRKAEKRSRTMEEKLQQSEAKAEGLLQEGMALSKKQGTLEATLRKMREEKRSLEADRDKFKLQAENSEVQIAKLKEDLKNLDQSRKRSEASMAEIHSSSAGAEKRYLDAVSELEKAQAKTLNLQSSLDEAWKETTEYKREVATLQQELGTARLEQEQLRHQLAEQINSTQVRNDRASAMEQSVAEIRQAMMEQGTESNFTEESLRREIKTLKRQLQMADKRNEELVSSSALATAPLLRQIEALDSINQKQKSSYESSQSTIMARVVAAENGEALAKEAKMEAEAARGELQLRVAELEASAETWKSEKSRLETQLKHARDRVALVEKDNASMTAQIQELHEKHELRVKELKTAESRLRNGLAQTEDRHERDIKEMERLHEKDKERLEAKVRDLENRMNTMSKRNGSSSRLSVSSIDSGLVRRGSASFTEPIPFQQSQGTILNDLNIGGSSQHVKNDADQGAGVGAPSMLLVQQLQSSVRQKEAQVESLKAQMESVERARDALSDELVRLSDRSQKLEKDASMSHNLRSQLEDKTVRLELVLEMLGEKEEQVEELQADIDTMRTSFRTQLNEMAK